MKESRIFNAEGAEGLAPAATALLERASPYDVSVVRGVFSEDDPFLDLLMSDGINRVTNTDLTSRLPHLLDVGNKVVSFMRESGAYPNMATSNVPEIDQLRGSGIRSHFDEAASDKRSAVGLQLSLCLRGSREFFAERVGCILPSDYSIESQNSFVDEFYGSITKGQLPRSKVVVGPGDIVMFAHNPWMTYHGVQIIGGMASARLINYYASLKSN